MWSDATRLLRKAQRRLWMKYALRGVGGNDNHARLDLAYRMPDPWNMESPMERARFEATNAVIEQAFGRVGSVLEIGCGIGTPEARRGEDHVRRHYATEGTPAATGPATRSPCLHPAAAAHLETRDGRSPGFTASGPLSAWFVPA